MRPFAAQHGTRSLFDPLQILHGTRNVQLGRLTTPAKRHVHAIYHYPLRLNSRSDLLLPRTLAGRDHFLVADEKALTLLLTTGSILARPEPFGALSLRGSLERSISRTTFTPMGGQQGTI